MSTSKGNLKRSPTSVAISTVGWAIAVLLGLAACRQALGIEEREVERRECRVYEFSRPECSSCVDDCCDEASACRDDPVCDRVMRCQADCPADQAEEACRRACEHQSECDGDVCPITKARAALRTCVAKRCESACSLTCGGLGFPEGEAVGAKECGCADRCCEEVEACAKSAGCGDFDVCRSTCVDTPICEACATSHPEGASLRRAVDDCIARNCTPEADWSCVGSVRWATPDAGLKGVDLHMAVFKVESVSACFDNACNATGPETPGIAATLSVPAGLGGYRGPLLLDALANEADHLWYLHPPAVRTTDIGSYLWWDVGEHAAQLGVQLDRTKGHLHVHVRDCRGRFAPGVQVTITPSGLSEPSSELPAAFYAIEASSLPVFAEWSPTAEATSRAAAALFLTVPPGHVRVTATVDGLCAKSAVLEAILIREETLTFTDLMPTPLD